MKFAIYHESRIGHRKNNQDRLGYTHSRRALLAVVADGMGGHNKGEVAAQLAVDTLLGAFQREATPLIADPFRFLQNGFEDAHRALAAYTEEQGMSDSPRTTCVACLVQDGIAYWAHVGDSRLYLLRHGRIQSSTRDHSRVRLLIDQGKISEAEAASHPDRNKVYTCIGGPTPPDIEFSRKTPLEAGDVVALCTDGVWGVLSPDFIVSSLLADNLQQGATQLMDSAEEAGGMGGDNLSLLAFRWENAADEAAADKTAAAPAAPVESVPPLSDEDIARALAALRSNLKQ
jgi:serine/threonine protein phosphatase PrpC